MFDIRDCIGFITNRGAKAISEAMNRRFKSQSVTRVQWTALYYIHENPGITQKQLADCMATREPTIVHLVDRMQQEGLVLRTPDAQNRRMNALRLTHRGEEALQVLFPVAEQFNRDATRGISPQDLTVFKRVMDRMIENVREAGTGGPAAEDPTKSLDN